MNFTDIFNRLLSLPISIKRMGFVIILLMIHFLLFEGTIIFYESKSNYVYEYYDSKDSLMNKNVFKDTSSLPFKATLKDMYFTSVKMKNTYNYLSKQFNIYQIGYTICFFYSAIILALLSFLIIKKGWDNTDNIYLKIAFLYFSAATSLFTVLPKAFNNDSNTKKNFANAKVHFALQLDLYHLMQDTHGFYKANQMDFIKNHITTITEKIKNNQDLYLDINSEAILTSLSLEGGALPDLSKNVVKPK